MAMYKNMELRKLPAGTLYNIIDILEINDDWKKVMAIIPKNPQSDLFEAKYNNEHMRIIEQAAKSCGQKCCEILFDEWGTSGTVRPTLHILQDIVLKAKIYRAADEIASLLQETPPKRPNVGPEAAVNIDVSSILHNENIKTEHFTPSDKQLASHNQATTKQMKSDSDNLYNVPHLSELETESSLHTDISQPTEDSDQLLGNLTNSYQKSLPNITFSQQIDSAILDDINLTHFEYEVLDCITNNFADKATTGPRGFIGRIGSGGFGDVYVCSHPSYGALAVKKLKKEIADHNFELTMKTFNVEVKFLAQFRHENIVPILGFSKDGPALCIVCQYIEGGSLEHKLQARVLDETQRLRIMRGTAEGLKYLHTSEKCESPEDLLNEVLPTSEPRQKKLTKNYFVHGDVKTANILLTRDNIPKLCDFGLAKQSDKTMHTKMPLGTKGYMAIEGYHGTISQKIDIYAYGVVLLELLTGRKAMWYVSKTETMSLRNFVNENCKNYGIESLLDPSVKNWNKSKVHSIYTLAKSCIEDDRTRRPTIEEICDKLDSIINPHNGQTG